MVYARSFFFARSPILHSRRRAALSRSGNSDQARGRFFWKFSRIRLAAETNHPRETTMAKYDITKTNQAVRQLIEKTENPRHRFLLTAYDRHRNLEMAGRFEEIFAPEMMSEKPVYHMHANKTNAKLEGQDAVKSLYRMWAETNQSIFYTENEQVAVADNYIASVTTVYQQVSGKALTINSVLSYLPGFISEAVLKTVLATKGFTPDENSMYIYKNVIQMIWPYDDRGRLVGEDVWEPDPDKAEITKLDPSEVLTTAQSAKLLDPLIKPLPSFDEMVLGKSPSVAKRA
jgi:hypothetical protein